MDRLQHAHRDLGLEAVKFGPIYTGMALADPGLDPVYADCQANNLPMTLLMGTTIARNAPVDLGRPIHVELVALRYPDLTIVMAHMGHPWHEDATLQAILWSDPVADWWHGDSPLRATAANPRTTQVGSWRP